MALVSGLTCGKNAVTINIDNNFLTLSFANLMRLQGFAQKEHFSAGTRFSSQRRQAQSERGAPHAARRGRALHARPPLTFARLKNAKKKNACFAGSKIRCFSAKFLRKCQEISRYELTKITFMDEIVFFG